MGVRRFLPLDTEDIEGTDDEAEATDCAGLVEAAGGRVKVVEGDPRLLKVTTADDLAKIASWL